MTCRERYNRLRDRRVAEGDCTGCPNVDDCEYLWDRLCTEECELHEPTPTGSCANIDESAQSL